MIEGLLYMILHGVLIGVLVSAPMGPVGIFCIQRTLAKGRHVGFDTGIGAALSDLTYCLLTGFCLSFIEEFIQRNRLPIQLFGSAVLILFGIYLLRKKPVRPFSSDSGADPPSRGGNILKGFLFTFSNPLILFLIIGLFAQFNFVIEGMRFYHYILGFVSIFAGALGWWWLVTFFVDKLRAHFNVRSMWLINRIIGVIILIFAAFGIYMSVSEAASAAPNNGPSCVASALQQGDGRRWESIFSENALVEECSFRVADLHADPKSRYQTENGKVRMPGWRMTVVDSLGNGFEVNVSAVESTDPFNGKGIEELKVTVTDKSTDRVLSEVTVGEGFDPYKGKNSWRLNRNGDEWSLFGGNREWRHVASFRCPTDAALPPVIAANPGGEIIVSDMEVSDERACVEIKYPDAADLVSRWSSRSIGPEGVYSLFDYDVDDALSPLGGRYRLAVVEDKDNDDGYDVVYLGGASKLPDTWRPGALKGRIRKGAFSHVYEAEWIDAEGALMAHDIHAEFDPITATLTFQFPSQGSALRFRKEPLP